MVSKETSKPIFMGKKAQFTSSLSPLASARLYSFSYSFYFGVQAP